jgi:hypothetical protein
MLLKPSFSLLLLFILKNIFSFLLKLLLIGMSKIYPKCQEYIDFAIAGNSHVQAKNQLEIDFSQLPLVVLWLVFLPALPLQSSGNLLPLVASKLHPPPFL